MFKSRYNIEVEGNQRELLLFNASSGAFAVLRGGARLIYEKYEKGDFCKAKSVNSKYGIIEDDMDFLFGIDPGDNMDFGLDFGDEFDFPTNKLVPGKAYVDKLIEDGFITLLTPDEELWVEQERFRAIRHDSRELTICLAPSYKCNHACPYCDVRKHGARNSLMSEKVIDSVLEFILSRHESKPFEKLTVQWYGSGPSLCLDLVEHFSSILTSFCVAREIVYNSTMLDSCDSFVDASSVDTLVECGVTNAIVTMDVAGKQSDDAAPTHFSQAVQIFKKMLDRGIGVQVVCDVDSAGWPVYLELRRKLGKIGIPLRPAKHNDCYGTFGAEACGAPSNDFFMRDEFASACHKAMFDGKSGLNAIHELLHPCGKFCHGQVDSYMVVDAIGDVYKCDGAVGHAEHRKFNILDGVDLDAMRQITFDATTDEKCSQCKLMPVCQGSCYWERERTGTPCEQLFKTVASYLRYYRNMFGRMGYNEYVCLATSIPEEEVPSLKWPTK